MFRPKLGHLQALKIKKKQTKADNIYNYMSNRWSQEILRQEKVKECQIILHRTKTCQPEA
jgi:hypothetical protein